jgi:hypothetical protein
MSEGLKVELIKHPTNTRKLFLVFLIGEKVIQRDLIDIDTATPDYVANRIVGFLQES